MSHDLGPGEGSDPDTDRESPDSTATDKVYAQDEVGELRIVDQAESDDIFATSEDEEFSIVDPLMYAPLLLVGSALVVFPEPFTSVVGFLFIAAGLSLAVVDLLSPDELD